MSFDLSPWVLDEEGMEMQIIKKIQNNKKKNPDFFYKFTQVFTSKRIFPTREALYKKAKRMNMDYDDEEDTAHWKNLAKRQAETSVLRMRVACGEASAVIDNGCFDL